MATHPPFSGEPVDASHTPNINAITQAIDYAKLRRQIACHQTHTETTSQHETNCLFLREAGQRRTDNWQPTIITALDGSAEFRSLGLSLPLSQIYEDVPSTATDDVQ
jgi:hypothetical protein